MNFPALDFLVHKIKELEIQKNFCRSGNNAIFGSHPSKDSNGAVSNSADHCAVGGSVVHCAHPYNAISVRTNLNPAEERM